MTLLQIWKGNDIPYSFLSSLHLSFHQMLISPYWTDNSHDMSNQMKTFSPWQNTLVFAKQTDFLPPPKTVLTNPILRPCRSLHHAAPPTACNHRINIPDWHHRHGGPAKSDIHPDRAIGRNIFFSFYFSSFVPLLTSLAIEPSLWYQATVLEITNKFSYSPHNLRIHPHFVLLFRWWSTVLIVYGVPVACVTLCRHGSTNICLGHRFWENKHKFMIPI